jgi:hypothetical protein
VRWGVGEKNETGRMSYAGQRGKKKDRQTFGIKALEKEFERLGELQGEKSSLRYDDTI